MTAIEAPPDEACRPRLMDQCRAQLRRRLGSVDGRHPAEHRGDRPRGPPGLPKIAVHWPLIDFECGPVGGADDFIEWFFKADRGELEPFVLVVEGSIPNEAIKGEGYWCGFGNNPDTDQPMTTSEWLDRLAPKALVVLCAGTCACYGGIHAMAGNPTGAMGVPDYLGWGWKSKAGIPIVCVPGCPTHPDNLSETILYLLYQATGSGADDPPRRRLAAAVAVRCHRPRGVRPSGLLRTGRLRQRVRVAEVHRQAGLLGAGGQVQRPQAGLDQWRGRLSERRRHLHRLHHARVSRTSSCRSWTSRPGPECPPWPAG